MECALMDMGQLRIPLNTGIFRGAEVAGARHAPGESLDFFD